MSDGGYYAKLFYKNMAEIYGYKKENMKDFICIGSNKTHPEIPSGLAHKVDIPDLVTECVCTHPIDENCWIWNNKTNEVIAIGNHCVNKFLPEGHGKVNRCHKCFLKNTRRKSKFCKVCELQIQIDKLKQNNNKKILEQEKKRKAREAGTYKVLCLDCKNYNPGYPRCYRCNQEFLKN